MGTSYPNPEPIVGHQHWYSVIYHPSTRTLWYRPGSPYFGTGLVPASAFLFILIPDWQDAIQSGI